MEKSLEQRLAALEREWAAFKEHRDFDFEEQYFAGTYDSWVGQRVFGLLLWYVEALVPGFSPDKLREWAKPALVEGRPELSEEGRMETEAIIDFMIPASLHAEPVSPP